MAALNYDVIWRLISQNKFVFESDEDLTCGICKGLLKDACQSYCGCQFCYSCISSFVDNENKYCPGNKTSSCNEEFILLNVNVLRSALLNRKISKLKVICPNQLCGCNIELMEMEKHLRLCSKQPMECPFVALGCNMERLNHDNVVAHLYDDTLTHTGILVELIQNMRNEINVLKENVDRSQLENMSIKNELLEVRGEIQMKVNEATANITRKTDEQGQEIIRLSTVVDELRKEIRDNLEIGESRIVCLRAEMETKHEKMAKKIKVANEAIRKLTIIVDDLTKDVKDGSVRNNLEMDAMKEVFREKENRIVELEGQLREMRNEMEAKVNGERKEREEIKEQRKQMEDVWIKDIKVMREERIIEDREKDARMNRWIKLNKLCPILDATFAWKFDGISEKIGTEMYSDSFYSNNYKLCLCMWVGSIFGDDDIYLGCFIMRGEYDDTLVWPMKRRMILSIIDKNTAESYKSETYWSSFNKPTKDISDRVGPFIIKYCSIKDNPSIIANDSIIVSCVVSD